ncbi:sulfotransferase-like domain-containing protein [Aeoliella mucimassa]|nr:HAD family hydrolase [Aeoliella mucimassa]
MWSGPRNISTALMRSWGSRPDTVVVDEPLYSHYLVHTGFTHHPEWDLIIRHHESDWQKVVETLLAPLPQNKTVFYQKHMAHHLFDHMSLDWTEQLVNVFLIRDPRDMLLSLSEFFPQPAIEETALPQQVNLFRREQQRTGKTPAVIDSRDVLLNPHGLLEQLCEAVGVDFDPCMLTWEAGPRDTDGIWEKHWYSNVIESTSFGNYRPKMADVPPHLQELYAECQALYDELAAHKLMP